MPDFLSKYTFFTLRSAVLSTPSPLGLYGMVGGGGLLTAATAVFWESPLIFVIITFVAPLWFYCLDLSPTVGHTLGMFTLLGDTSFRVFDSS